MWKGRISERGEARPRPSALTSHSKVDRWRRRTRRTRRTSRNPYIFPARQDGELLIVSFTDTARFGVVSCRCR
jgi:hypothetical protein